MEQQHSWYYLSFEEENGKILYKFSQGNVKAWSEFRLNLSVLVM